MRHSLIKLAVVLAVAAVPALAAAQPGARPGGGGGYYNQPSSTTRGGFWDREGRLTLGLSLGIGGMSSDDGPIECPSCSYNPLAVGLSVHVGGMLSSRFALLGELQGNVQTIEEVGGGEGTQSLAQFALMVAAQYWIVPKVWIKGGIGVSHLSYSYDDYYGSESEPIDDGGAVMVGAGVELLASRDFALELQGRYIVGSYDGIQDNISSGTIGIGVNWY